MKQEIWSFYKLTMQLQLINKFKMLLTSMLIKKNKKKKTMKKRKKMIKLMLKLQESLSLLTITDK